MAGDNIKLKKRIFVAKHVFLMVLIVSILIMITSYTQPLTIIHYLSFLGVGFFELMYFLYARDKWKIAFNPKVAFSSAIHLPEGPLDKKTTNNEPISESDIAYKPRQTVGQYQAKVNERKRYLYDTRQQPTQENGKNPASSAW
jgi:hypothetical protein